MSVLDSLFYTKDHEWIKIEGNVGTMGITNHAQEALGDVTFIELPKIGNLYKKGDIIATVESVKAASDVYAPMSGKIVKVNDALKNTPETINKSPYENGWFCVIELTDLAEKNNLMPADNYREYLKTL
ncbi:MAG: glycine cleavage system protein GcvH [Candidatus Omnitrophota bacterium]